MLANFLSLSIYAQAAEVFLPPDIFGSIPAFQWRVDYLTARLAELLRNISCPSVICDDRGYKKFGGTDFLL